MVEQPSGCLGGAMTHAGPGQDLNRRCGRGFIRIDEAEGLIAGCDHLDSAHHDALEGVATDRTQAGLNAAGRLLYLPLIGLSLFGQTDLLGTTFEMVSRWSPGGCLETLLSVSTGASSWAEETWGAVLASVAYIVVFGGVGVRYFRWTGK
jgi:hypothetical protein